MRLNFGSGIPGPEGWTNVNLLPGKGIDFALDARRGLPFADDEVDYAVCHHVLDLFTLPEVVGILRELHRVIKPGGILRVSLADQWAALSALTTGDEAWFSMIAEGSTIAEKYEEFASQRGARKSFLDEDGVTFLLTGWAGFAVYDTPDDFGRPICALDSRQGESFFVEAVA